MAGPVNYRADELRPVPQKRKAFVATRADGLGGRLMGLVNAIYLAKATGSDFGFTWQLKDTADKQFHFVAPAGRIFSHSFIEQHWVGSRLDGATRATRLEAPIAIADLVEAMRRQPTKVWTGDSLDLLDGIVDHDSEQRRRGKAEAFATIAFSDEILQVLAASSRVALPENVVALHLRSGDIVHGSFRSRSSFHDKIIPSPLAKAIIAGLGARNCNVLLFGEHAPTLKYLSEQTGAMLASTLGSEFEHDFAQRALFEMAIMARCASICAANSVFAKAAAAMGGNDLVTPDAVVGGETLGSRIMDELARHEADYDPLEAAFAYQWICFHAPTRPDVDQQLVLLRRASVLDPPNRLYPFKIATLLFERGDPAAAELLLGAIIDEEMSAAVSIWQMPLMRVAMSHATNRQTLLAERAMIARAGDGGHPNAALLAAISYSALGVHDRARAMVAMARKVVPNNRAVSRVARFVLGRTKLIGWLPQPIKRWLISGARQISRHLGAAIGRG